jgi:type I restriction enzyme S subunit
MKSKWQYLSLRDCITHKKGFAFKSSDYTNIGTPIVKVTNTTDNSIDMTSVVYISDELAEKNKSVELLQNDIVIATVGSWPTNPASVVGKTIKVPIEAEGALLNQNAVRIRPLTDSIDKSFLYYLLKNKSFSNYLVGNAQGSANQASITLEDIYSYETNIPPLPTQKKIAHILSTLDDKIELNRKMNQTLESMASAIFKSWFVDFDPVHAKANCTNGAELENIAKKLGISKAILDLFPNEFEESELGMIPKGWEVVKIEEILKRYQAPKRYKKEAVESFGKTVVLEQGTNIILGYHDGEAEFQATEDEPMFIFGDHTCIMKLSTKPFSISENVIPLSGLIRNGYWTYYATYGQQTFQEYRRHWSELIVKEIVMSDKLLCDLFAKQVKPLILKIEQNILENNELAKTRDTLLPKLLSGEIDVSDLSLEME